MTIRIASAAAVALAAGLLSSPGAYAATVFSDNFNTYAYQLNWVPPANWTVTGGSVDLIGHTTTATNFNFYPGNGGYVDLDGSTHQAGTMQTDTSFAAGTYTLSFDLGGNARGDVNKTTDITLGNFTKAITLASSTTLSLFTYTFTTTGGKLIFGDLPGGNQDIGNILDNVTLSVTATPLPPAWTMMLAALAGLGFFAYRGSKKASDGFAAA